MSGVAHGGKQCYLSSGVGDDKEALFLQRPQGLCSLLTTAVVCRGDWVSHEGVKVTGHEAAFFTSVCLCALRAGNHVAVFLTWFYFLLGKISFTCSNPYALFPPAR